MMQSAGRSCVRTKKFSFCQQIENFPFWLRRGTYESPKHGCKAADCTWILIIESVRNMSLLPTNPGDIQISLKREDYKNNHQSVEVRLTVLNSFKVCSMHACKEIHFTPYLNQDVVLRMKKNDLFGGYFSLNKIRFMPNDILTVRCEITIYEIVEEKYASENYLEDTTKYAIKQVCEWFILLCGIAYVLFFILTVILITLKIIFL